MGKKVAIVGAGVGGLAAAARLSSRGYRVEIFEKLSRCGGRAHIIEEKGFKFDTGPSFVLMPDFYKEVFHYCGKDIGDYLDLRMLDPHYTIFYSDGTSLTIHSSSQKTKQEMEAIEKGSSQRYDAFMAVTARMYEKVKPLLSRCVMRKDIMNPRFWKLLAQLEVGKTAWQLAKKYFKSDKLCYAFTFEAMFIGVSPFETPAFYSVITYADHVEKIFHPLGGMYQIPLALEKLAKENGASFYYNSEVKNIVRKNGRFTLSIDGRESDADIVVINADYPYAVNKLLKRPLRHYVYSCSVYLVYLGLKRKLKGLEHHNLFFSRNLENNLDEIFELKKIPTDPSFYVHIPTKTDPSLAPEGKDLVYILIPVANLDGCRDDINGHKARLRKIVFDKINGICGINLEDEIEVESDFKPQDFVNRYNVHNAATFGLSHILKQSAFFRPYNKDVKVKDLYYVGCSTQPGEGLPPVIASSRIVADMITGE
jgi:phytoene desaturase